MIESIKSERDSLPHFRIDNRPDDWTRLEAVFDEEGKYRSDYLQSAKEDEHEH